MNLTLQSLNKSLEDLTRVYNDFSQEKQILETRMNEIKLELQNKVNEANNYIDSQLAAASQGIDEKIESKVSTAMAGEEAAFLEKVDGKISKASQKLNNKITEASEEGKQDVLKRFINYFKNGYIQLPGMPSPLEDVSLHFEGYSWHEVNYDGNFFRAKGRNAKPFSSKKLTKAQIKNGTYAFTDDEQGDAIRNIYGETGFRYTNANANVTNGVFKVINPGYDIGIGTAVEAVVSAEVLIFQASNVVPTAEENRSRNLTFTIWALVKDEE